VSVVTPTFPVAGASTLVRDLLRRRTVTARDTRTASARRRPAGEREQGRPAGGGAATAEPPLLDRVVVGQVPVLARVAGVLLLVAGVVGAVAPFLTYLVVGGRSLSLASGVGSALVALLVPLADLVMGAGLARGRMPKAGLAYAGVRAALSVGGLLIELYRGSTSTDRPAVEVLAGRQVITSTVEVRPGWVLGVAALVLVVLAGVCALAAWGRTLMEDGGTLDPVRSALAGGAVLLGVATVLCLTLPSADLPDRVVTDPATGMQTVVSREGPQALLERPGMALLGGLLLAGAVVLCSVVTPSLRPRLATVGGLLAIAVTVLSSALSGLRDAVSSTDLEWTVPGAGLLVAGVGYAALVVLAWRVRRGAPVAPLS
jgi:hypothetical protein